MAHGHEHADHGHEDEAFPRLAVSELVGDAESSRKRREGWQAWLVGLGLAALALGLPAYSVGPEGRALVIATVERAETPFVLGPLLARAIAATSGWSVERAWYLLSALTFGLSFPLLVGLLRSIGFSHAASMFGSGIALGTSGAWVAGTEPGDQGLALAGAIVVARALFAGTERLRSYAAGASLAWLGASVAHAQSSLLWPFVGLAVWRASRESRGGGGSRALALALPLLAAALLVLWVHPTVELLSRDLKWFAVGLYLMTLGVAPLGALAIVATRRVPEESPPPGWARAWAIAALIPATAMPSALHGLAPLVIPVAAIGFADWLDGRPREELLRRWGVGLLVLQIATVSLVVSASSGSVRHSDVWRPIAREHLEPDDRVITPSEYHLYLLRHRWGVEATLESTLDEDPAAAAARWMEDGDRRIVLDRAAPEIAREPAPRVLERTGAEYWVLTERGVVSGSDPWLEDD